MKFKKNSEGGGGATAGKATALFNSGCQNLSKGPFGISLRYPFLADQPKILRKAPLAPI